MLNAEILLTIKLQDTLFADPRRVELLRQIKQIGSINQAAKLAGVSYKTAWDNIDAMSKLSPKPLLERNIGGKQGGGTSLTTYAERLLQLYELLKQTQERAFEILHEEDIPLDSLLIATAKSSLQTSARNQFFGKVSKVELQGSNALVSVDIEGLTAPILAKITLKSCERLRLTLGREVMLMIKAPWIQMGHSENQINQFTATVNAIHQQDVLMMVNDIEFCATTVKPIPQQIGDEVVFHIDPEQIILATL